MRVRWNMDIESNIAKQVDHIAQLVYKGNKTEALHALLTSAFQQNIMLTLPSQETYAIQDLLRMPSMDLHELQMEKLTSKFRENFYQLPLAYRLPLFDFLFSLTRGQSSQGERNKFHCFLSTQLNLACYYTDPQTKTGRMNFYMNITGKIGEQTVKEKLIQWNIPARFLEEEDSPLWLGKYERFTSTRSADVEGIQCYEEILRVIGVEPSFDAVQLRPQDMQQLKEYFQTTMNIHHDLDNKLK